MRADIVPGATFPDYELPDHTGKHRKLSELQGGDPMILVLSRGRLLPEGPPPARGFVQLFREMEVGYCRLVTHQHRQPARDQRVPLGRRRALAVPVRSRAARYRRISTSPSTPIPTHNPMVPHTLVLEPGLVVHKIYNGYWFFGRPTLEELRQDLRAVTAKVPPGLGPRRARAARGLGARREEPLLSVRQDLRPGVRRAELSKRRSFVAAGFHVDVVDADGAGRRWPPSPTPGR